VIEAPLVKKRKLTKAVEATILEDDAMNIASFLAARRKQMPKPFVPCIADVKAFLANEPVEASSVNAAEPILVEPLATSARGSYPNIINFGSSPGIQHSTYSGGHRFRVG
jgi:hypothetical protein